MLLSNPIALVEKIPASLWFCALVILAVYAPALRNGFVWDDTALILRDPLIRSWRLIPEGFQHFLFIDATPSDFYRPIQRLTYLADYAAFVFKPAGYHFTSILCHIGATLALLLLANELLRGWNVEERKRRWIAFLAALVWAVHPVHTAAVAYISGRADPLAALFGFLGLYCGVARPASNPREPLVAPDRHRRSVSPERAQQGIRPHLSGACGWQFLLLRKSWKQIVPAIIVDLVCRLSVT